ncbi:MAG: hypothetical protein ACHQRL_04930 [Gemmatimonadales bacterium]
MPLASGAQWIVGTTFALIIARRSRLYAAAGAAPRRIAWLAFLIFAIELVAIAFSLLAAWRDTTSLRLPEYATVAWRYQTVTVLSLSAWVLVAFAAIWNAVLGVALRRRTAIQELKRRTDRVRDYRTPRTPPAPQ